MDANLTQVEANPIGCWERMTPLQLQYFENRYYARIEKEAQRELRITHRALHLEEKKQQRLEKKETRLQQLEEKKRQLLEKRETKYLTKVLAMYQRINHLHSCNLTEEMVRYHGRSIGNDIHDLPYIWTGYESEASVAARSTKGYNPCREHFWPRQYAGEQIINWILTFAGIEFETLGEMLNEFRQVHHVTPEENRKLMPFQSVYNFTTPEAAYKQAGIILIKREE